MRIILIFLLLVIPHYSLGENIIKDGEEVIITGKEPELKAPTPEWVNSFDREASRYNYTANQPWLKELRSTGSGNCVAFAKLGAWHALGAGYDCRLISITSNTSTRGNNNRQMGHMLLYATSGRDQWVVSNKSRRDVLSLQEAILRVSGLGYLIIEETTPTLGNIDSHNGTSIRSNELILTPPYVLDGLMGRNYQELFQQIDGRLWVEYTHP